MIQLRITLQGVPDDVKPGLKALADHLTHCANAMLSTDDLISTIPQDGNHEAIETKMHEIEDAVSHVQSLIETSGPLLAEVEQPLEGILFLYCLINKAVMQSAQENMTLSMALGNHEAALEMEVITDHTIAVIAQVFMDVVITHLQAINYLPTDGDPLAS